MHVTGQKLTVEAFDAFLLQPENQDRRFELIDGEIVEKMPTELHAALAAILTTLLSNYAWAHAHIRVGVEARYRAIDDPRNERLPDVSLRITDAAPVNEGSVSGMPDLAVEVKSPTDTYRLMKEKAQYYLAHGSKMVWLVYPEKRLIEVWTAEKIDLLDMTDTLSGEPLLPGFTVPVADIFNRAMR